MAKTKVKTRWREGERVEFRPIAASLRLYTKPPAIGEAGTVTPVSFGAGRKLAYIPGPGGGLVYVEWDSSGFMGVSPIDVVPATRKSKTTPAENPVLTAAERRELATKDFAWPEHRAYPVHDAAHAKNALARLNQAYDAKTISKKDYRHVYQNVMKAYARFGLETRTLPRVPMLKVLPGGRKPTPRVAAPTAAPAAAPRKRAVGENPTPAAPEAAGASSPVKAKLPSRRSSLVEVEAYDPVKMLELAKGLVKENPTSRSNPVAMRSIAQRALSRANPAMSAGRKELGLSLNVADVGMTAAAAQVNLSSLEPEEYYDLMLKSGVSPDRALASVEELASWGVTDEV